MEGEVEKTLRNLTVVSMAKQHDKLITTCDTFAIQSPTPLRSLYRRWYGEGRDLNIQRLQECVHVACAHVSKLSCATHILSNDGIDEENRMALFQESMRRVRLINALKGAQCGIRNMIDTYADDTSFQVRLRLLMQKVDDFLTSLRPLSEAPSRPPSPVLQQHLGIQHPGHPII